MKKTLFTILVSALVILNSCGSTESETSAIEIVELQIAHYKTVASGPFPGLYFVTQSSEETGSEDWSVQYSPIENFDYEWGYSYKILAEKRDFNEETDGPLMDAPAYRYIFLEEISKTKVQTDSTFEIILQRTYGDGGVETYIEEDSKKEFTLLGVKPIDCTNLCNELTKERDTNTYLTGTFQHTDDGGIKLVDLKSQPMN